MANDGKIITSKVLELRDELPAMGVNVPFVLKRRDPHEPGRRRKEQAEDQLASIFMSYFAQQKRTIRDLLMRYSPERKAVIGKDAQFYMDLLGPEFFGDEKVVAKVARLFTQSAHHAIQLFAAQIGFDMDYTLANVGAAKWASEYAFDLVKGIDKTTTKALQSIFSDFVKTPGMTIGNVVELLPYPSTRALMIATTEVTRVYSEADKIAGEELAKEFPGVKLIKRWFTNRDDRVCPICGPLEGVEVEFNEPFIGGDGIPRDGPPAHVSCRCARTTTTRITE